MKHTVELVELANGVKGLLIDVSDASVMNFDFSFRAGDYISPPDKWDTAHIMEHLVFGANQRFKKASDYSEEFCKNGSYNNASTGTYHMSYEAECADFEAERILDLLCLAIEAPLFLEPEFIAEKSNVREELKGLSNNHFSTLSLNLGRKMGFCELDFKRREQLLDNIELNDIKEHYKNTHTTSNMRFLIAGNIKPRKKAILDRISRMSMPKGTGRIDLVKESLKSCQKPLLMSNPTVDNVYYRWEIVIDHVFSEPEEYASSILFGATLGTLHSRIFGAAREAGLVYSIGFGKYRTRNNNIWWLGGQVLPDNIHLLFELIVKELISIAGGQFTEQETQAAKQYALGNFQRSVQTVGQLLGGYYSRFVFDDEIEEYDKVPKYIENVTRDQVVDMARLMLSKENAWGLGFYGAINQIDPSTLTTILTKAYL
jgi:predicted Zn-dependent peptidase